MPAEFNVNTTKSEIYVVELQPPFQRQMIQFVPESISTPRKAEVKDITIIGRNNDLLAYINGKETLTLNLDFVSDAANRKDVKAAIDWLKSLTYADKNGRYRNVRLIFGELFKNEVWVVTAVDPDMSYFDAENGWLPMMAKVKVDLKLDPTKNLTLEDLR